MILKTLVISDFKSFFIILVAEKERSMGDWKISIVTTVKSL